MKCRRWTNENPEKEKHLDWIGKQWMFGLTRNGEGRCQTLRLAKPENFFLTFFFSISKHSYVINVLNITFGLQIWKLSHGHDCLSVFVSRLIDFDKYWESETSRLVYFPNNFDISLCSPGEFTYFPLASCHNSCLASPYLWRCSPPWTTTATLFFTPDPLTPHPSFW